MGSTCWRDGRCRLHRSAARGKSAKSSSDANVNQDRAAGRGRTGLTFDIPSVHFGSQHHQMSLFPAHCSEQVSAGGRHGHVSPGRRSEMRGSHLTNDQEERCYRLAKNVRKKFK
ncbi:hypothetical protein Bbelb_417450 [Branchiostoma belcheri]|nr:hypothetical protein Bbelb_417450 [Branchiostoma belcheri]